MEEEETAAAESVAFLSDPKTPSRDKMPVTSEEAMDFLRMLKRSKFQIVGQAEETSSLTSILNC